MAVHNDWVHGQTLRNASALNAGGKSRKIHLALSGWLLYSPGSDDLHSQVLWFHLLFHSSAKVEVQLMMISTHD